VRQLAKRAGGVGVGGDAVPAVGQSVCGAQDRVESCCRLQGTASATQSPDPWGRCPASSFRRRHHCVPDRPPPACSLPPLGPRHRMRRWAASPAMDLRS
jgi:hypothetical protein